MPEPVVLLSEKARISNAELITKTDLGPAEGSMGGNVLALRLVAIWRPEYFRQVNNINGRTTPGNENAAMRS